ncbi:40S RIBOSOMAL PROTEIN S10 [Encephalitozoon cuniculi GB-M1]|uniref:40S RIBOSOMAL PROTEIN S10 n=1 Tax=Encephalitozoon cuniculi (strain GB-M1) TaxID=284813 RepID=Q8SS17_ENCCU|nr:40S ribosomal protein S10 [Encephalitozoon cuniculi GB-M1]KMV66339.1 40S ribosomal protein S10 [Encephalitozoon cuniculi EcunIII-L]UYI27518.1 ribosomal protein S10 [Encephalitozoon cuniculi]7QEP_C0 Chain C0, 40S RIBOSOMAL PROTEIN S10 [Encephalitozoon cuniculi GB-M1]CAD25324.1 40S RIBOSOMAL PROTEIN S10 [Encephalitozoon cuniculi GB-M1]
MLVPTANKYKIKRRLLEKKALLLEDTVLGNHRDLEIPNLHLKIFMKTMISYGYVQRIHVWRHSYFLLTPLGESRLREELVFTDEGVASQEAPAVSA